MRGKVPFTLAATAVLWCGALVVATFVVPVQGDPPLAEQGLSAPIIASIPLASAAAAFLALRRRCSVGSERALGVAWGSVALMLAVSMITVAGPLVYPAAALLVVAALKTPLPAR